MRILLSIIKADVLYCSRGYGERNKCIRETRRYNRKKVDGAWIVF